MSLVSKKRETFELYGLMTGPHEDQTRRIGCSISEQE